VEVKLNIFIISVVDGCQWLASHTNHFIPRERPPSPPVILDIRWVEPRAGLDMVAKLKIPGSTRNETVVIESIVSLLIELFLLLSDMKLF
jgi:hypothetical protein